MRAVDPARVVARGWTVRGERLATGPDRAQLVEDRAAHLGGQRLDAGLGLAQLRGERARRVDVVGAPGSRRTEAVDELLAARAQVLHPLGITGAQGPLLLLLKGPQGLKVSQQG